MKLPWLFYGQHLNTSQNKSFRSGKSSWVMFKISVAPIIYLYLTSHKLLIVLTSFFDEITLFVVNSFNLLRSLFVNVPVSTFSPISVFTIPNTNFTHKHDGGFVAPLRSGSFPLSSVSCSPSYIRLPGRWYITSKPRYRGSLSFQNDQSIHI